MHSKIKDIKGTKGCTASNCIKAKDGNLLMEREDVLNRWSEYIEDLFQDDRGVQKNWESLMESEEN